MLRDLSGIAQNGHNYCNAISLIFRYYISCYPDYRHQFSHIAFKQHIFLWQWCMLSGKLCHLHKTSRHYIEYFIFLLIELSVWIHLKCVLNYWCVVSEPSKRSGPGLYNSSVFDIFISGVVCQSHPGEVGLGHTAAVFLPFSIIGVVWHNYLVVLS